MSSSNSSPSVPCPAITTGSSNGWQNAQPVAAALASAAATASVSDAPPSLTVAPNPRHASILPIEAPAGTKISHAEAVVLGGEGDRLGVVAGAPGRDAVARSSRPPSDASLFIAPRILNEPVRCRFSALSTTEPPTISDSVTDDTTGVCLATDRTPLAGPPDRVEIDPVDGRHGGERYSRTREVSASSRRRNFTRSGI